MSRLTARARRALPSRDFAGPGRSFPIPPGDKGHARAALREINHAAASARPNIRARARAVLGKAKGGAVCEQPSCKW